jgi:elongation factor P
MHALVISITEEHPMRVKNRRVELRLRGVVMVIASELKEGTVIRIDRRIYRVLEVESKAGTAKLGGVVKTKLSDVRSGRMWEPHFRPQERLEELDLERSMMEFLFSEGDTCTFMDPNTYEQIEIPKAMLGSAAQFLQPGIELPVEFFAGEPISVVFPAVAEARVQRTAPPAHSQQDSAWKEATLENGLSIQVPLFIAPGEVVRVEVKTGRYVERAHSEHKRSA